MSFPGQELIASATAYVERVLSDLGLARVQLGPSMVLSILLAPGALIYLGRRGMSQTSRRPPIVSHWIPWVGSALEVQKDPDSVYRRARQELGPVFGVRLFGSTLYHVADTDLITAIYKQPQMFSANPMQATFLHIVFGMSMEACKQPNAVSELIESMHRHLSPTHFEPLLSSFIAHSQAQISSLPLQMPVSLHTIVTQPMRNVDCAMLFGSNFLDKCYNQAGKTSFSKFDESVPLLAINFPAYLMRDTIAARTTLIDGICTYLEEGVPEDASELLKEAVQIAHSLGWSIRDQATYGLSMMWPLLANAPIVAYWLLAFHLFRPGGLSPLYREVHSVLSTGRDLAELVRDSSAMPYLDACINETIRLATDSYSVRWVPEGDAEAKIGEYVFKPGDQVVCNLRGVNMDELVYAHPESFEPERFLGGGKDKVRGRFIPFGGGFSVCSGRHLATTQIKAYMVTLLSEFEVELENGQAIPGFSPGGRGFGGIRPVGDVRVRLERRKPPVMQSDLVDSPVEEKSLGTSQFL
ncbi:cytochrome P450 family protein [Ceratobasidium sp. AG-Ba]|nr:cytochrome P450 family protein [Ceratobasidium sp. AG-Ba]